ncbi:MAG: transposase [Longimicrobiales bacterium]
MRTRRSHLPGAAFHITSRTTGREHWFTDQVKNEIVAIIAASLPLSDAHLIAYAVMSNHFHLVIKQGARSLAQLMQPICRRIALAVHRVHGREGHVFERSFRDIACVDPDHLRHAIIYTHRNPTKAGICNDAGDYAWSSHHAYCGTAATPWVHERFMVPFLTPALGLFARTANATPEDLYAGYARFMAWRDEHDRIPEAAGRPPAPLYPWGDTFWGMHFSRVASASGTPTKADLRDLVNHVLRVQAPNVDIEWLRLCRGGPMATIRNAVIARAIAADHRGADIARYLNVSESLVSRVATSLPGRPRVRYES